MVKSEQYRKESAGSSGEGDANTNIQRRQADTITEWSKSGLREYCLQTLGSLCCVFFSHF